MLGGCILKPLELARPTLPSISSRAPDKTHLPAPQQDHGILFLFRRTPRVLWQGISGSLDFTSIRKTRRNSRHDLVSPAMWCECAMEPIGPVWPRTSRLGWLLQLRCPLLGSDTGRGLPCVRSDKRAAHLQGLADASYRGQDQPQQPFGAGKARKRGTLCNG